MTHPLLLKLYKLLATQELVVLPVARDLNLV